MTVSLFVFAIALTLVMLLAPWPWPGVVWITVVVITVYVHFAQDRWIHVCKFCGKQDCTTTRHWVRRRS